MNNITPFEALLVTHLLFDWWIQTTWQAFAKENNLKALLIHCGIYTLGFVVPFYFYHINAAWLILIFVTHAILDKRQFLKDIKGLNNVDTQNGYNLTYLTVLDQTLHIFVLFAIVLLK
jgi:hypothetical protein